MSGVYFGQGVRLKSHSALTKGGKSAIKIELETADHYEAASILRQLDEIGQEQKRPTKPAKPEAQPRRSKEQLRLPAPLLQLEDHREHDT